MASPTTPASATTNTNLPADSNHRLESTNQESHTKAKMYTSSTTPVALSVPSSTSITSSTTFTVMSIKARSTDSSEDSSADFTDDDGFAQGHPIKAFSGLESNNVVNENVKKSASSMISAKGEIGVSCWRFNRSVRPEVLPAPGSSVSMIARGQEAT
ncbi:hypothetical protein MYU51_021801 [Penicillium brevicompactum]